MQCEVCLGWPSSSLHRCATQRVRTHVGILDVAAMHLCLCLLITQGSDLAWGVAQVLCQSQVAPGASLLASLVGALGDDFVPSLHPPAGAHDFVSLSVTPSQGCLCVCL